MEMREKTNACPRWPVLEAHGERDMYGAAPFSVIVPTTIVEKRKMQNGCGPMPSYEAASEEELRQHLAAGH